MPISGPNNADNIPDSVPASTGHAPDNGRTVLELRTAARYYGISPEALRKRIQRGKAEGYKEDGRWLVVVDTADRTDRKSPGQRVDKSTADLYERLLALTAETTRYKTLAEVSESTLREAEQHYKEQIAELQAEKAALEARLAEVERPPEEPAEERPGFWRRVFRGEG